MLFHVSGRLLVSRCPRGIRPDVNSIPIASRSAAMPSRIPPARSIRLRVATGTSQIEQGL